MTNATYERICPRCNEAPRARYKDGLAPYCLGCKHADDKERYRLKKLSVRERDIERYLVRRVKALGGEVRKVKFIGHDGAPDRVVWLPSDAEWGTTRKNFKAHQIWIELKAPGKKPEPHQLREHKRLRKMGQRVEVVDSFERVDEVLT